MPKTSLSGRQGGAGNLKEAPKNTLPPQSKRIRKTIRRKRNTNPFTKVKKKAAPGSNNILAMRANKSKTVTDKNGETVPLKTSAMINYGALNIKIPNFSYDEMEENFHKTIANDPAHRPIEGVTATSDYTRSPTEVGTPNGTRLNRCGHYGAVIFFSNENIAPVPNPKSDSTVKRKLDFAACREFRDSEEYQLIKQFFEEVKTQEINVTQELYAETDRERKNNNFRRCISQNEVMSARGRAKEGSASKYANKLLLTNLPWEWLHEIAHEVAGSLTQCMENLVGGTKHANTDMIFVENNYRYLAECYPEGFTLSLEAKLVSLDNGEYSQVARIIEVKIKTKDFELPFHFNAQNTVQPHISFANYVSGFIHSLVETCRAFQTSKPGKQTANKKNQPLNRHSYFYHKPETASTADKKKKGCLR